MTPPAHKSESERARSIVKYLARRDNLKEALNAPGLRLSGQPFRHGISTDAVESLYK